MRIFKYSDLSDQYTENNITSQTLLFKFLDEYNDELEGNYLLVPAEEFESSDIGPNLKKNARAIFKSNQRTRLACCFCRTYYNQAMWGKYGTDGRNPNGGVCVEYETELMPGFLHEPVEVAYVDGPRYMVNENKVNYVEIGATKGRDWSTEDEFRYLIDVGLFENPEKYAKGPVEQKLVEPLVIQPAVKIGTKGYTITHSLDAITGIYFGARAVQANIDKLQKWAADNKISVYKMVANPVTAKLERVLV